MDDFRSQRIGSESGFTLIELLAVTAILMILSLLSVPVFDTLTDKGRLTTSLQDMRVIEQGLEAYHAKNGRYPDRLSDLTTEGFLRRDFAFRSPWATEGEHRYFFYAVDTEKYPRAYVLGDPGPNPNCSYNRSSDNPPVLSAVAGSAIPCGTKPESPAREFTNPRHLVLSPLPDWKPGERRSLSAWRASCDPRDGENANFAAWCIVKTN